MPGPNLELGVDLIPDLVDVPSALIVGMPSGLTSAVNTILPAVRRESFCTCRVEMLLNKQTNKIKNQTHPSRRGQSHQLLTHSAVKGMTNGA